MSRKLFIAIIILGMGNFYACGTTQENHSSALTCSNSQPYEIWIGCAKTKSDPANYVCVEKKFFKTNTRKGFRESNRHFGGTVAQNTYNTYKTRKSNSIRFSSSETSMEWSFINVISGTGCK